MASYGALTSLLLSLDNIRDHNLPVSLHSHQLQSLREKVSFLLHTCPTKTSSNHEPLETRIRDVAFQAEDLIAAAMDPDNVPGLLTWISYSDPCLLLIGLFSVIITAIGSRDMTSVLTVLILFVGVLGFPELCRNLPYVLHVLFLSVTIVWFPILRRGLIPIFITWLIRFVSLRIAWFPKLIWSVASMLNVLLLCVRFDWFQDLIFGVISVAIAVFIYVGILWFSQLNIVLLMKKMVVSYILGNWVLNQIFKEIQLIAEVTKGGAEDDQLPSAAVSSSSRHSRFSDISKNTVVGMDGDLEMIKTRFAYGSSMLQIVPIVGMGGIGKTTLATMVYKDNYIHDRFDVRAWATVSENYSFCSVVLDLLNSAKLPEMEEVRDDGLLGDRLYKILYGRRYLVVLDDVWDVKVWDDVRRFLPHTDNGSCVLLTTRSSEVARYANPCEPQHQMQFLHEHESQRLLHSEDFGEEECPEELRGIQDEIARNCKGLPLALRVIGGLLFKIDKTQDSWRSFAHSIKLASSKDNNEYERMELLALSYKHLPLHLKPCFLYMGTFPEECEVSVTNSYSYGLLRDFYNRMLQKVLKSWPRST